MNDNRLNADAIGKMNELPRWVDAHSVDCLLCDDLADERETVETRINNAYTAEAWTDPRGYVAIERIVGQIGHGEIHQSCFKAFLESDGNPNTFSHE